MTTRMNAYAVVAVLAALVMACAQPDNAGQELSEEAPESTADKTAELMENEQAKPAPAPIDTTNLDTVTLGAGCFWCVEAVFNEMQGVHTVVSGYTGGHQDNPTYKEVCEETTGHAEVAQITFDPAITTFAEILEVFWKTHDPTTLNRQGNDFGSQYRSAVFYHNDEQRATAEKYKQDLDAAGAWPNPIVTEITAMTKFWPAEDYHQEYFANNPNNQYCQFVVGPKVDKFRKVFKDKLKR